MNINRDQLLTDQAHRREVIAKMSEEMTEAVTSRGYTITEAQAERSAREMLRRIFDLPEIEDAGRFPA